MHNAAFRAFGLGHEWRYEAIDVAPSDLPARLREMAGEGLVGANVTIPHKQAALALADDASEVAREIGAANTLTLDGGRIHADNTDGEGLLAALPSDPSGEAALVLGAGGAARAVVWALVSAGARVSIWNRTPARAAQLADELGAVALPGGEPVPAAEWSLVVNATSVGLDAQGGAGSTRPENPQTLNQLPISADSLSDRQTVVDLVYGNDDTELVRAARERGAAVIDGLEVLIRQGAASFRIWTGLEPPIEAMRRAARNPDSTG